MTGELNEKENKRSKSQPCLPFPLSFHPFHFISLSALNFGHVQHKLPKTSPIYELDPLPNKPMTALTAIKLSYSVCILP